jgi:hypothetical protein
MIPFFPEFSDGAGRPLGSIRTFWCPAISALTIGGPISISRWHRYGMASRELGHDRVKLEFTETLVGIDEQNNPLILFVFVT